MRGRSARAARPLLVKALEIADLALMGGGMTLGKSVLGALALSPFVIACSDPKPATPRGSLHVAVNYSSVSEHSGDCQFGPHEAFIGGDAARSYPNEFQLGGRVVDNENGAKVSCKVAGSGSSSFSIAGNMRRGAVTLTMNGTVPQADFNASKTGSGNVQLITSGTIGHPLEPVESNSCIFTPVEVAPGKVWSKFDCPLLQAQGQQNTYCGATGSP
jgi:hypothetical protein